MDMERLVTTVSNYGAQTTVVQVNVKRRLKRQVYCV